jgi:nitrite reductase (NADH) large subunit
MNEPKAKSWICSICGYVHHGPKPPVECPICGGGRDLFEPYQSEAPKEKPTDVNKWKCLICQYIHLGPESPDECPICGATADQFEPYVEAATTALPAGGKQVFVIVGAGIAGVSAAEAIRKNAPNGEILLLSREPFLPYYRLNLTRYLAGEVSAEALELHPRSWYREHGIDLRLGTEILELELDVKRLRLKSGEAITFDKLVLAMGSHPYVPSINGVHRENVTVLRTLDQADAILKQCRPNLKVVCIGGGILGLEAAGALAKRGANVTVLEGFGWLLPRQLNQRSGEILGDFVETTGIKLVKKAKIKEIEGDEHVRGVLLENGDSIPAELVIITTGVRPNSYLARMAGIDVNQGIVVNNQLRTSHPDVYAAGDVAEHSGMVYGVWGPAQFMGTIAGMNAAGGDGEFAGIPRSNMLKVLGYDLFSIGAIQTEDASYEIMEGEEDCQYKIFIFRDQHLIGSILLGDISVSAQVKKILEQRQDCSPLLKEKPALIDLIRMLKSL